MPLEDDFSCSNSVVRRAQHQHSVITLDIQPLYPDEGPYPAILFFGRFDRADILTLGLNPSSREVTNQNLTLAQHVTRPENEFLLDCYCYFDNAFYWNWFNRWLPILGPLNASYQSVEAHHADRLVAAHIDLCPRPTRAATALFRDQRGLQFQELVSCGIQTLLDLIAAYRTGNRPQLVISAGTIGGIELIERLAREQNSPIQPDPVRSFNGTPAAWSQYLWQWPDGHHVPVLSCTTGPSAWAADRRYFGDNFRQNVVPHLGEVLVQ